jgi:hypothetical protein
MLGRQLKQKNRRRRGGVKCCLCREPLLGRRSLVRRLHPALLRSVEDLQSPQHDDDGRYQRGRRQYTF